MENSGIVPQLAMEAVKRTKANLDELNTNFDEFLSLSDPEALAELPPLRRAQSLLILAKAASTLFTLKLRCTGVHPDDHPIKGELERLSRYQDKLERFINVSKEPLQPKTKLNYQAATRFIEHSLPDLTVEQRKSMREISRGERGRVDVLAQNAQKKRKYPSSGKQSVQAAAQEFLKKAAQELYSENTNQMGIPGPLRLDDSDED